MLLLPSLTVSLPLFLRASLSHPAPVTQCSLPCSAASARAHSGPRPRSCRGLFFSFVSAIDFLFDNNARCQVLRLLQVEQKAQSDTSMCAHSLQQCDSSLAESRAAHKQAMDRLQQADGLRLRKQLELEMNKGDCVPAAEVQIIEENLQTVNASEFSHVVTSFP